MAQRGRKSADRPVLLMSLVVRDNERLGYVGRGRFIELLSEVVQDAVLNESLAMSA